MRPFLLAAAAALALAGAPAHAACNGCGGAALPGGASLDLNGTGTSSRHVLKASCHYATNPNGGTSVGALSTDATAFSTYDPSIAVSVSCSLSASGGNFGAAANGTNSNPNDAHASAAVGVPPLMTVYRLCLAADAVWQYGNDTDAASVRQCIRPGLWGGSGDVAVEVPIGGQQ